MVHPVVEVSEGKLLGKICSSLNQLQYYSFKGIPYAKAPIGELRFAAPEPPEPWEGLRSATKNCNICMQFDKQTNMIIGEEDCLYLNVYTPILPAADSKPLPVMLFLHGGGFLFGNGTDDTHHGPDYLIEKDVVIVSINYRLGILGFLSLDCKEAPGNMGLKDQVQALKWVQKNIGRFGGDPSNVTIFGISAGGSSVEYLLLSPTAKRLFHKAINQSGSSLAHWSLNKNIKRLAAKIPIFKGKILNDDSQLLKYLKELPAKDLVTFSMLVLAAEKWRGGGIHFGFVPTIEKSGDWEPFLTESPYELLSKGEFNKVPYITGFCSREGLLMTSYSTSTLDSLAKDKTFLSHLPFHIDDTETTELENKLKSVYLESDQMYDEPDAFTIDFFTDVDFLGPLYVSTTLASKNNPAVYFYEFAYDGGLNYLKKKLNIDRNGACHGDDGGYIIKSSILSENISDTDKVVRERMVKMWTDFARTGDPTPEIDKIITTKWEPIAETGIVCLKIDNKMTMNNEIYPKRMKLYVDMFQKYSKQ